MVTVQWLSAWENDEIPHKERMRRTGVFSMEAGVRLIICNIHMSQLISHSSFIFAHQQDYKARRKSTLRGEVQGIPV